MEDIRRDAEKQVTYEITVIDDCLTDESVARIKQFQAANPGHSRDPARERKPRAGFCHHVEGSFIMKAVVPPRLRRPCRAEGTS